MIVTLGLTIGFGRSENLMVDPLNVPQITARALPAEAIWIRPAFFM